MGRLWTRLSPVLGLLLFAAALWVLNREVRHLSLHTLSDAIRSLPRTAVALAAFLTVLNYIILTCYDQLAFVYIRRPTWRWRRSWGMPLPTTWALPCCPEPRRGIASTRAGV